MERNYVALFDVVKILRGKYKDKIGRVTRSLASPNGFMVKIDNGKELLYFSKELKLVETRISQK
jgi:hypothetical protein